MKQMGVGGTDTWSTRAAPIKKYRIPAKHYNYSFWIIPYQKSMGEINKAAKMKGE